jgi:hypothetical protein
MAEDFASCAGRPEDVGDSIGGRSDRTAPHVSHIVVENEPATRALKLVGKREHWRVAASDTRDLDISARSCC